ncbi:uncharacterized protein LOC115679716 [Syzygium oleosum]|uniref:uncharacterized protein LOC115679716 n=1 Tax=Syzygium oleosum TaxID=219896 RepID=UPI0024BAC379|nr:uncharacterized protein LOC115679716 [Syzygium oleosum]
MEGYPAYPPYPDSGNSSPRSREIDFDAAPWDDQQPPSSGGGGGGYKAKFMCSYGGKIHPRPHDNQLSYMGGETKILSVDRHVKLASFLGKLSALCELPPDGVSFKYQFPGEDLDALISVTTDDDLEHMMHEYDRLSRACSKPAPARMRLFLFPVHSPHPPPPPSSADGKSDRDRFVEALNSGPSVQEPAKPPPGNADFLFGLEKGVVAGAPPAAAAAVAADPVAAAAAAAAVQDGRVGIPREERVVASDHGVNPLDIQRQLQELQRLQISCGGGPGQEAAMYRRKSDDNMANAGCYGADNYYLQKLAQEKTQQMTIPTGVPQAATAPPGYWQAEKQIASGGFPAAVTGSPEQPMYMIPAPGTIYHAPPQMVRQVAAGQGYYTLPQPQRFSPDVYRDQPVYNVVHPPSQAPPLSAAAPPALPPQTQLSRVAGASPEGVGVGAMRHSGGSGMADNMAYAQLPYDGARQVFYTAAGGMVVPPPQYQGMTAVSADMRQGGAVLNQEGKVVAAKVSQGSL